MSTFVLNCPKCLAQNSTFSAEAYKANLTSEYRIWEIFSVCRACSHSMVITAKVTPSIYNSLVRSTISSERLSLIHSRLSDLILKESTHLNDYFFNFGYYPIIPMSTEPPEYLPIEIEEIFTEASKCLSIGCFNASAAMFRLCLDIVTKKIVEQNENLGPTRENKKTIHSRLSWIFQNNILHRNLEELARCIKDDGNDGAHDGNIGKAEADDLLDFTVVLLDNVYTQPERIRLAQERRLQRRQS
ncbi:TPA: DUF4145 domain-containing protein [Acinetobacter baumannii]|nr:DUF4145 domain-containing protein [Acinetobacter baumannii]MDC5514424.1 DUF4145 domain-containing protein [Acinetobacter baumannii]